MEKFRSETESNIAARRKKAVRRTKPVPFPVNFRGWKPLSLTLSPLARGEGTRGARSSEMSTEYLWPFLTLSPLAGREPERGEPLVNSKPWQLAQRTRERRNPSP